MSRFFVSKDKIDGGYVTLSEEDSMHLARVLRANIGDEITVCDDGGKEHLCTLSEISKRSVTAKIESTRACDTEPKVKVTLFQGLPKGSKMEMIIQKCVEIGITSIVPVATERAVVRLSEEKGEGKAERWNKISEEAAKQSSRGIIPFVGNPIPFKEAAAMAKNFDMAIIPYEKHGDMGFRSFLRSRSPETVAVYVGPEGGFEESEIALALENGIEPVSLGKRILRTETAPISVLSVLMYEYDLD